MSTHVDVVLRSKHTLPFSTTLAVNPRAMEGFAAVFCLVNFVMCVQRAVLS